MPSILYPMSALKLERHSWKPELPPVELDSGQPQEALFLEQCQKQRGKPPKLPELASRSLMQLDWLGEPLAQPESERWRGKRKDCSGRSQS